MGGSILLSIAQVRPLVKSSYFSSIMRFARCKEQQHSQTDINRDYDAFEAPPGFQAGWSDYFFFTISFLRYGCSSRIPCTFHNYEGTVPYRS
jgi:hypothetical protein